MSKHYIVNCYTCQHNGQETCKGCNTLLVGESEPYENWQLREDLETKDHRIAELEEQLKNAIVPKFKIGQEVWFVYDENDDFNYTILNKKVMAYNYFSYEGGYFEYAMSDDGTRDTIWYGYIDEKFVFSTKAEAEAKLEELKGNNYVY